MNKNEKCILLNYKDEFIFRLYNLIKKKVIRANNIHFIKKRSHFVNFEKEIEIYKSLNKRQRFFISTFTMKEALNKQRIIVLSNAEFVTSIKSLNRLPSADISLLIINRFQRSHSVIIIMRVFMTFIKSVALIARSIIISPLSIFLKFIKMKTVREHPEYEII